MTVEASESLLGTPSRRIASLVLRGEAAAGGLPLVVASAAFDTVDGAGTRTTVGSETLAADRRDATAEVRALAPFAEALRGARVHLTLDPERGITAIRGLDAALDGVVERDPPLAHAREGLRVLIGDSAWLRALRAAGLGEVPRAVREGGAAERRAEIRLPGRGETTIVLRGLLGEDESGLPALRLTGELPRNVEFAGDAGAAPPDAVGALRVEGVRANVTTTYERGGSTPRLGEWGLEVPFARGPVLLSRLRFSLVER